MGAHGSPFAAPARQNPILELDDPLIAREFLDYAKGAKDFEERWKAAEELKTVTDRDGKRVSPPTSSLDYVEPASRSRRK